MSAPHSFSAYPESGCYPSPLSIAFTFQTSRAVKGDGAYGTSLHFWTRTASLVAGQLAVLFQEKSQKNSLEVGRREEPGHDARFLLSA